MSQYRRGDATSSVVWPFIELLLELLKYLIFGVFIVSVWLTRMLFENLLNPLTEGAFDRHDGAVVLTSAGLWSVVSGGLVFPLAMSQGWMEIPATEIERSLMMMVLVGLLWGGAIGGFLVMTWWNEIDIQRPVTTDISRLVTGSEIGYVAEGQAAQNQGGLSLEEIERLLVV